ncbi:Aldehyde oxidase GLOX [Vanrija pseudolonga]|uniref:Aldehyde oxidase GLOX n=1 Tax=Vanrija pseudolonga TaxID=143232 RepID=A0AAF1BIZ8_9TREE|nr:Aldehyde oxidase GLOX [Vanrija pseudolonga]
MLLSLVLMATAASAAVSPRSSHGHRDIARRAAAAAAAKAPAGGFDIVGDSGVSAQMMFLGTKDTVFILDKSENNSMTVTTNGVTHPAWGSTYNLQTNEAIPIEVTSNTFCAGGFSVANGSWVVFGGNQPVTYGGVAVNDKGLNPNGTNPYTNTDGGAAIRLMTPCDDGSCPWYEGGNSLTMAAKRWYPTIEGLADGSVIVLGGDHNGGYVSTFAQNEPSYEYWPKQSSGAIPMNFLNATVPVNLFPLTWLLPSGKLFLQAAYKTILYDLKVRQEIPLQDMPYAQRVYPASAAAAMLPLTPQNGYSAEILFCGGSAADLSKSTDGGAMFNVTAVVADNTCVRIRPDDANPVYTDDDKLPEPRCMGSFVYLPDGTMWLGNGVGMGTAGYGDDHYSLGQSYGQHPVYMPVIYNPNAPAGSRFNRDGLSASSEERMYHSTAILLADGSVLVSGSNPNKDVTNVQWGTKYSVEKWYPTWYNQPRPIPTTPFPSSLSYGGDAWTLNFTQIGVDPSTIKVAVVRTGFSTHGMNFGQRYLELETSYSLINATGEVTLTVGQMPINPNIFTPGPAMIFLVVNGIPSEGELVVIGNGQIGTQPIGAATVLPQSQVFVAAPNEPVASVSASLVEETPRPPVASAGVVAARPSSATTVGIPATLTVAVAALCAMLWS